MNQQEYEQTALSMADLGWAEPRRIPVVMPPRSVLTVTKPRLPKGEKVPKPPLLREGAQVHVRPHPRKDRLPGVWQTLARLRGVSGWTVIPCCEDARSYARKCGVRQIDAHANCLERTWADPTV